MKKKTLHIGEIINQKIKEKGIRTKDLVKKMNFTDRSNLYYYTNKSTIDTGMLELFSEAIGYNFFNEFVPEKSTSLKVVGNIPYYEIKNAASDINLFDDEPETPSGYVRVPGFEDCTFATDVYGHSMYPTYENGAIILCKKINDFKIIPFGECYLIITEEQRLVKRLMKHPKNANMLLAVSDNIESTHNGMQKYAPLDIPFSKIRHLFIIKGTVKRTQL